MDSKIKHIGEFGDDGDLSRGFAALRGESARQGRSSMAVEAAIVHSFDHSKQRVSVRMKNFPNAPIIRNIPIMMAGGPLRLIIPLHGVESATPTTGLLLFPTSDSANSYRTHTVGPSNTSMKGMALGPVFLPGIPIDDGLFTPAPTPGPKPVYDAEEDGTDSDNFGPLDGGLIHESGSHIIFKGDGDIVIRGNKVFIMTLGGSHTDTGKVDTVGIGPSASNLYAEE